MLQFDEYKVKLNNLAPTLEELGQALDLEGAERELDMLQAESAADGFWNNLEKAQKVQQRIKTLQNKVDKQHKRCFCIVSKSASTKDPISTYSSAGPSPGHAKMLCPVHSPQ